MTKTILLTGATGTLGSEVINQIKKNKNIRIIITSRKKNKNYKRYEYNKESIPVMTASASEKNGITSLTITNANPNKSVLVDCDLGSKYKTLQGKIVTGNAITDYNDFEQEEKVVISDFDLQEIEGHFYLVELTA